MGVVRLLYPVSSATLAGWSVLLVKSTGEIIKGTIYGHFGPWMRLPTYLTVAATVVSLPMQIVWTNKGLLYFDSQLIGPIISSA